MVGGDAGENGQTSPHRLPISVRGLGSKDSRLRLPTPHPPLKTNGFLADPLSVGHFRRLPRSPVLAVHHQELLAPILLRGDGAGEAPVDAVILPIGMINQPSGHEFSPANNQCAPPIPDYKGILIFDMWIQTRIPCVGSRPGLLPCDRSTQQTQNHTSPRALSGVRLIYTYTKLCHTLSIRHPPEIDLGYVLWFLQASSGSPISSLNSGSGAGFPEGCRAKKTSMESHTPSVQRR